MPITLHKAELEIATDLYHSGLSWSVSVLAVVMATRAHYRPEGELAEIVRQYPRLEDPDVARQAIRELLRMSWLESSESYGREFTHQAPDLREKIDEKIGKQGTAQRLLQMATLESPVTIVGAMTDEVVYSSFLENLGRAQGRIRLPMLATTPYPETVRILKERAEAGVHIQLLLGAPGLVAKWRGDKMRAIAADRIESWRRIFKTFHNVKIRISRHPDDMAIATCVGIDDSFVRLDVYDPVTQRSLQGVMVEIESPAGKQLNLVRIFFDLFDNAWRRALSPGKLAQERWFIRRFWKLELGVVVTGLAFVPIPVTNWTAVLIGLGTGILAPSLIDEAPKVRVTMREWRRS